jgi:hypothetical protein
VEEEGVIERILAIQSKLSAPEHEDKERHSGAERSGERSGLSTSDQASSALCPRSRTA